MKLYATVSSERATKGQGGNKFIEMTLFVGDAKAPRKVVQIRAKTYQENGEERYAILGSWHGATEQEKLLHTGTIKGEKQKGERTPENIAKWLENGEHDKLREEDYIPKGDRQKGERECKDCGQTVPDGQVCQLYCKACILKRS